MAADGWDDFDEDLWQADRDHAEIDRRLDAAEDHRNRYDQKD